MMTHLSTPVFSTPLLESVGRISTMPDAKLVLRDACTQYRFQHFVVISLSDTISQAARSLSQMSIVSNWPPELSSEYDRLQLASDSPLLKELQNQISPVLIDMNMLNQGLSSQKQRAASELFSRHEVTMGISFPIQDAEGLRYAVCFLGNRDLLSDDEVSRLGMFSTMLIEHISRIVSVAKARKSLLTVRELEVLQWTAEGKTSSEISRITRLSEHTVNHYATIATKKLGCSNRTQAVVQVMRMGMFR